MKPFQHLTWMRDERGQTLVLNVLVLFAMVGIAALVIEGGRSYKTRRDVQGIADAAAMAAVQELPQSTSSASYQAQQFATTKNSDATTLDDLTFANNSTEVSVRVKQTLQGGLLATLKQENVVVTATARAQVSQVGNMTGMLPMAFMKGSYTIGQNTEVKFDGSATGNRGPVRPDNNPPHCYLSSGASDFRNLIKGDENGGMDACGYAPGDLIQTETGNMSGPTRQGFDGRIGTNSQSFSDVFTYDAASGNYTVKDKTSPRLGWVPVIENTDGTATWPSGSKDTRVLAYVLLYIGKTDTAGNPAYTGGGRSVWVTPVAAVMPEDWDNGDLMDYDPTFDEAPKVFRMVE